MNSSIFVIGLVIFIILLLYIIKPKQTLKYTDITYYPKTQNREEYLHKENIYKKPIYSQQSVSGSSHYEYHYLLPNKSPLQISFYVDAENKYHLNYCRLQLYPQSLKVKGKKRLLNISNILQSFGSIPLLFQSFHETVYENENGYWYSNYFIILGYFPDEKKHYVIIDTKKQNIVGVLITSGESV